MTLAPEIKALTNLALTPTAIDAIAFVAEQIKEITQ
jgi:hypothetical protein